MKTILVLSFLALVNLLFLFSSTPVGAQKDQMRLGESLGAKITRSVPKAQPKTLTIDPTAPSKNKTEVTGTLSGTATGNLTPVKK